MGTRPRLLKPKPYKSVRNNHPVQDLTYLFVEKKIEKKSFGLTFFSFGQTGTHGPVQGEEQPQ